MMNPIQEEEVNIRVDTNLRRLFLWHWFTVIFISRINSNCNLIWWWDIFYTRKNFQQRKKLLSAEALRLAVDIFIIGYCWQDIYFGYPREWSLLVWISSMMTLILIILFFRRIFPLRYIPYLQCGLWRRKQNRIPSAVFLILSQNGSIILLHENWSSCFPLDWRQHLVFCRQCNTTSLYKHFLTRYFYTDTSQI